MRRELIYVLASLAGERKPNARFGRDRYCRPQRKGAEGMVTGESADREEGLGGSGNVAARRKWLASTEMPIERSLRNVRCVTLLAIPERPLISNSCASNAGALGFVPSALLLFTHFLHVTVFFP